MTRFLFSRRFNRFDVLFVVVAISLGSRGHMAASVIVLVVGSILSVIGETALRS